MSISVKGMVNNKKLSIIIVLYNSGKLIFECLDSLYRYNDIGSSLEIILVDNCSSDREFVFDKVRKDYPSDIILIKSLINGGYGHGNNQGAAPIAQKQQQHECCQHPSDECLVHDGSNRFFDEDRLVSQESDLDPLG